MNHTLLHSDCLTEMDAMYNIDIQIEKTAIEAVSRTLITPNNLFDDAEAAFDRAFEVLREP